MDRLKQPWNEAYRREAEVVAGQAHADWGQRWAAVEYFSGRRKSDRDVAIAMRALMLARGELNLADMAKALDRLTASKAIKGKR